MENEELVDWENCIRVETENPFYLNLTECFSQDGYRGTCKDGTQNIARYILGTSSTTQMSVPYRTFLPQYGSLTVPHLTKPYYTDKYYL